MYLQDITTFKSDNSVKTKVVQLYTNRALSYHQLNEQDRVLEDSEYVLKNLDKENNKALFRRGVALKVQRKFEDASRDF